MRAATLLGALHNPLFSPALMIYAGKVGRALFGFAMSLIVARWLGPEQFGLFSLFVVVMIIGHDVLGEGLNPSVVRFYTRYADSDPLRAKEILANAFTLRVILGMPILIIGLIGGKWLAEAIWQDRAYSLAISLGLIGAFGAALWSFTLSVWQALEEFRTYAMMTPLVNALRICTVPLLVSFGQFTLANVLGLHVGFFYICAIIGMIMLRRHMTGFTVNRSLARDLLHFGKWTVLANLFFLLQAHLGIPFLSYFADAQATGIYAAGSMLLLMVDYLTATLMTVLLPEASKLADIYAYRAYAKRYLLLCTGIAVMLVPFVMIGHPVTIAIYGSSYAGTGEVFQILFVGFLATLITHPLYLIFYAMNRPYLYTISTSVSLACWLIVALWLIPSQGAIGAAWAMLVARLIQSLVIGGLVWRALQIGAPRSHEEEQTG